MLALPRSSISRRRWHCALVTPQHSVCEARESSTSLSKALSERRKALIGEAAPFDLLRAVVICIMHIMHMTRYVKEGVLIARERAVILPS
jgi:hypothetical protein